MKITFHLTQTPNTWQRLGSIIHRGADGEFDSSVTGDPCIVWDEQCSCYRMFYFAQCHVAGKEINQIARAVSRDAVSMGPGSWRKLGPIAYTNPQALLGNAHKPWILMDPYHPNLAAKINDQYWLFMVIWNGNRKIIQAATSPCLSGDWSIIPEPVVTTGNETDFDGYHVDTVTAYWFKSRGEILIFYKGYPGYPQTDTPHSPYGSRNAAAILIPGNSPARKIGCTILSEPSPDHWAHGWIGGLQIFPAKEGGWYGLLNASPTPPAPISEEPEMREPAPSQGGWAYTPEDIPVTGWKLDVEPIEWVKNLPDSACQMGESTNLWRHHLIILPNKEAYLYYNSGSYGQEQLYGKHCDFVDNIL
jgi:hypothetical protein